MLIKNTNNVRIRTMHPTHDMFVYKLVSRRQWMTKTRYKVEFHKWIIKKEVLLTFNDLLKTASHDVDVFYTKKLKFDIFIKRFIFISFPGSTIGHGIYLKGWNNEFLIHIQKEGAHKQLVWHSWGHYYFIYVVNK